MGLQISFLQRGLHSNWQILVKDQVLGLPSDVQEGSNCEGSMRMRHCPIEMWAVPLHAFASL